jgi:demethoxyubiquinone hydroxylase (CLK1/Coq7/Cat5 family)
MSTTHRSDVGTTATAGCAASITPALRAELRSDHAGEAGAVQIYRGILACTRDAGVQAFARRHLEAEQEHLRLIEQWQPPAQRSRLTAAWRLAGWLTGALPALCGPAAVYATIGAVETFVDHHYAQQIALIDALPSDPLRADLRRLLVACQADEIGHRDEALASGPQRPSLALRAWMALVGFGSAQAVKVARRF